MHVLPDKPNLLEQIEKQEAECLTQIHRRFCLLNGRKMDIADVEYRTFADKPNYWEYYYIGLREDGKKFSYMLMSRELTESAPGEYDLNIVFNKELMNE